LRRRDVSALGVTEAYLDCIERLNPRLNALWWLNTNQKQLASAPAHSFWLREAAATLWVDQQRDLVVVTRWIPALNWGPSACARNNGAAADGPPLIPGVADAGCSGGASAPPNLARSRRHLSPALRRLRSTVGRMQSEGGTSVLLRGARQPALADPYVLRAAGGGPLRRLLGGLRPSATR
jgi:hypothetical protein